MTSCLRNALKMRSTEHFPNSPQFTFSAFSLGCQAFVVIFINSDRWLLPFLPGKLHLPLEPATILQQTSHGAGFAPISPANPFFPHPVHYLRPPLLCLLCASNLTCLPVAKLLIYPNYSPSHKAQGLQYGTQHPPRSTSSMWLPCTATPLPCPVPLPGLKHPELPCSSRKFQAQSRPPGEDRSQFTEKRKQSGGRQAHPTMEGQWAS